MSDDARPDPRVGLTIDLSSPRTGKRPRKGPPPVVTQTINLSTPKPPKAEATTTPAAPTARTGPKPAPQGGRSKRPGPQAPRNAPRAASRNGAPRDAPRDAGGTSLADLLDEATLARLRGG